MKRYTISFLLPLFFFLLLLFPEQAFEGASRGLLLWFRTVLPTLLPFVIVTNLLLRTNMIVRLSRLFTPLLGRLFSISTPSSFAVAVGFLCGYPMGAKVTADLVTSGTVSQREGSYLLSFCNNASPAFFMNYLVLWGLERKDLLLPTFGILMSAPVLSSFLFRIYYKRNRCQTDTCEKQGSHSFVFHFELLDDCIMNGFEVLTKVGGYIILFSVLVSLFSIPNIKAPLFRYVFLPSLEVTNAVAILTKAPLGFEQRYLLALSAVSFGGVCSMAQTKALLHGTGISMVPYIIEKLITALVTSFLAYLYLLFV